jgi:PAS domain S-box-containing protein
LVSTGYGIEPGLSITGGNFIKSAGGGNFREERIPIYRAGSRYPYPFGSEQGRLFFKTSSRRERNLAPGVYDPVPWQVVFFGAAVKNPGYLSGIGGAKTSHPPCAAGRRTVTGGFTPGNRLDSGNDGSGFFGHGPHFKTEKGFLPSELKLVRLKNKEGNHLRKRPYLSYASLPRFLMTTILPLAAVLLIIMNIIFFSFQKNIRDSYMEDRKSLLKETTLLMRSWAEEAFSLFLEAGLDRSEAEARVVEIVGAYRFGENLSDYFWILTPRDNGEIYLPDHPNRTDLVNVDISGETGFNDFFYTQEMVRIGRQGGGFLWYLWNSREDPEVPEKKLAYLTELPSMGWVLGAGVYTSDIEERLVEVRDRFVGSSLFGFLVVVLLFIILGWTSSRVYRANEQLSKDFLVSESRLRNIFNNTREYLGLLSARGEVIALNQTALKGVALKSNSQIEGKLIWEAPWWRDRDRAEIEERVSRAARGEKERFELAVDVAAGPRIIDFSLQSFVSPEKRKVHLIMEGRDVTDRKEALEKLNRTNKELRESREEYRFLAAMLEKRVAQRTEDLDKRNKELAEALAAADAAANAKSLFLANMSHELRTPLNGVITAAALAQDQNQDESLGQFLKIIEDSGRTLMGVINDVLDFSKIEAGRMELEEETILFSELVELVTSPFRGIVMDKQLQFRVDLDPRLPMGFRGDPLRLRQILLNLVGNAVKFTNTGGSVVLDIQLLPDGSGGEGKIRFSVKDTGIGIPRDKLENLFSPFSQADGTITRKYGGTGLGLTISSKLAVQMGSQIQVESQEGAGALFFFDLELVPVQEAVAEPRGPYRAGQYGDLQGLRVLVAEDNQTNRELIRYILEQEGINGIYVENGLEALKTLGRENFDVVLMDIQMPVLDGFSAVQRIRSRPEWRFLPVIAMTAFATLADRERCLEAGMDDHVAKPINRDELFRKLQRLVAAHGPSAPGGKSDDPSGELQIDREATRIRLGGLDDAVLDDLYRMFVDDGSQIISWLKEHQSGEEKPLILEKVHNLKGMAANIGVNGVFERARSLESAWKEDRPVESHYIELFRIWEITRDFLANLS